jgi:hypothetical protein
MQSEINLYNSPDELILQINMLYLIFGFGTGDAFNAIIHLQKSPPIRNYELIIKKPQVNLVQFLTGMFSRLPSKIHVVDYWKHDFSMQIKARFPTLPYVRGIEPNSIRIGFIDFWQHPFNYNKIIPLVDDDIMEIINYFQQKSPMHFLPNNSVVMFPTAGTNFSDYLIPWKNIVKTLREQGIQNIFVNQSGISEYGDEIIDGAEAINFSHDELIRLFYSKNLKIKIIAVRSGVLDILRFCEQRALVFYQPNPSGIFETCRFGLLRHNMDIIETICLNISTDHQDQIINYYVKNFICSSLES